MREKKCIVDDCYHWRTKDTKDFFYGFPCTNQTRVEQWIRACKLEKATKNNVICSRHFSEDCFKEGPGDSRDPGQPRKRQLKLTAVPNQALGVPSGKPIAIFDRNIGNPPPEGPSNKSDAPLPADNIMEQLIDPDVDVDMEFIEEIIEENQAVVDEAEVLKGQEPTISSRCRLCFKVPADDNEKAVNLFDENGSQGSLAKDLMIFFQLQFEDSPEWPSIVCGTCVEFIKQMKAFQRQIMTSHSQFYNEIVWSKDQGGVIDQQQIPMNPDLLKKNMIKCDYCERLFFHIQTLSMHINSVHGHNIACETCGKVFGTYLSLRKHRLTHLPKSERPHKCPHCESRFATSGNLSTHVKRIHDIKTRFMCEDCGKGFTNYSSLYDHRHAIHIEKIKKQGKSSENGNPCQICGLKFINLSTHMKFTHGEGKTRITSQYDPIEEVACPVEGCGKIMRRLEMRTHSLEHSKGTFCQICLIRIGGGGNAQRHLNKHRGLVFPCEHCDKVYDNDQGLYLHIKSKHVDVYEQTIKRPKRDEVLIDNCSVSSNVS